MSLDDVLFMILGFCIGWTLKTIQSLVFHKKINHGLDEILEILNRNKVK